MEITDPSTPTTRRAELIEADLTEVDVAIALVSSGAARRVCLAGLRWPEIVAPTALAHAQAAAVGFRIDRTGLSAALIFGSTD